MNKFAKNLLPPDSLDVNAAYQDFCNIIKKADKKTIPRRYRNNYVLCCDAECESLYKNFLQSPQGDNSSFAAIALPAKFDRKRRGRWSEAVQGIDFSHSSPGLLKLWVRPRMGRVKKFWDRKTNWLFVLLKLFFTLILIDD